MTHLKAPPTFPPTCEKPQSSEQPSVSPHSSSISAEKHKLNNWRRLYRFAPRDLPFPTLGWNYNFLNLGGSTRSYRRFAMSVGVNSDNVFLSALRPNLTVSTYAVPSESKLSCGGSYPKEETKFKRVHQQVSMRMAEKSTLPRQNGSSSQYAASGVFLCAMISL